MLKISGDRGMITHGRAADGCYGISRNGCMLRMGVSNGGVHIATNLNIDGIHPLLE